MNDVIVHSNSYITSSKTFVQKYLPQLVKIYERPAANLYPKKVVIFDLDETIGSFGDLYFLWKNLPFNPDESEETREQKFSNILDIYPEFFRPGIFAIIEYIYRKIERGVSFPIHVYTNTQCDLPNWVNMILRYIERRVITGQNVTRIFSDPICAFKIGGKRVNLKRTTQNKTPADFVRCSLIPKGTEICFVDDQTHANMKTKKIYYIQPPPYRHPLSREIIMDRFYSSKLYANYFFYSQDSRLNMNIGKQPKPNTETDEKIGKKILYYVREFFLSELPPSQHTRKRTYIKGNTTRSRK